MFFLLSHPIMRDASPRIGSSTPFPQEGWPHLVNLKFIMVSEEASKMDRDDGGAEQDAEPVVVELGTKRG